MSAPFGGAFESTPPGPGCTTPPRKIDAVSAPPRLRRTRRRRRESPPVGHRWSTSRIEAFSDGVFAIAITLLVLDIRVPPTQFDDLWQGIADEWPAYFGFATSFLTSAASWLLHHGVFRRLRYADVNIIRLNLLLLMAVSFLPFPTRLMAE